MKLGIKLDADELRHPESKLQIWKCIGNLLDHILFEMEEKELVVPAELHELKQYLRFKGNSLRENGDLRYWKNVEEGEK